MADRSQTSPRGNNKVPEVTLVFWIIKLLSTTVGETAADYLAVHVGLGTLATDALMGGLLMVALFLQWTARSHVAWRYWLVVVLVSIVGTQVTDFLTDKLEISLYLSTAVFSALLAATFWVWHRIEGTLSVKTIFPGRREAFYWLVILFTFALGTAAGDLATEALQLGFRLGTVVFGGLIFATWVGRRLGLDATLAFWIAYVLTRPLGASLGDFLSQAQTYGGLGLGTVVTSAVFFATIVILVVWISRSRPSHQTTTTGAI
jgi:uncharacterized membrane-anchored protein